MPPPSINSPIDPDAPHGLSAEAVAALRRRLHDGLCQHLAAGALLQTTVSNRLGKMDLSTLPQGDQQSLVENAHRVQELIYEALDEARAVLRSLDQKSS